MLYAFDALRYLVVKTRERHDDLLRHKPFAFDEVCLDSPSKIEIIYHIDDKRFSYAIEWDKYAIHNENLKEIKGKSEIELFCRWYDVDNELVKIEFMPKMYVSDDEAYIIKTNLLKNNSLLSIITKTNISHSIIKNHFSFLKNLADTINIS